MINNSIQAFYMKYACYLGLITSKELIKEKITPRGVSSLDACAEFIMDTLRDAKEKDDPLYGVKGVSSNALSFIDLCVALSLNLRSMPF